MTITTDPASLGLADTLEHFAKARGTYTCDECGLMLALSDLTTGRNLMQQAAILIRTLATPNLFWPEEDHEFAVEPREHHDERFQNDPDDLDPSDVLTYDTARTGLPPVYTAIRVTRVLPDGRHPHHSLEFVEFSDHDAATRCYPDSLAAAREAAGLEPEAPR